MGRMPTFRDNFNDLKKLTLADLKRLGFMIGFRSSNITWSRNGEPTGSIGVTVNLDCIYPGNYVELEYTYRETEKMKFRIALVQKPSNLGKGMIWYFVCPLTGERCRTLYQTNQYFASRKSHSETLYDSQTRLKEYRSFDRYFGSVQKVEDAFEELFKPYAKPFYRGKPTPKARKVLTWQQKRDIADSGKAKSWEEYVYSLKYDCGM